MLDADRSNASWQLKAWVLEMVYSESIAVPTILNYTVPYINETFWHYLQVST